MSRPIWYDSTEAGAPTLNNVAGSLLDVLRACLINGFNTQSITSISVTSGVATATAAAHGYSAAYGKLLRIEGAPVSGLNGDVQPLAVDTNTFTYAAVGVPDGTYTGTITARRAPLGWTEAFTGTNKAMFGRAAPEAKAMLLRVDDTASPSAGFARVHMVESAMDVDTYTDPTPTAATLAGGGYWSKGAANITPKRWVLIGDELFFWLATEHPSGDFSGYNICVYCFGDPASFGQVDPYLCILGIGTDASTNVAAMNMCRGFDLTQKDSIGLSTLAVARYSDGATKAGAVRPIVSWQSSQPFGGSAVTDAPASTLFGMIQTQVYLRESFAGVERRNVTGLIPGLALPMFWIDDIKATYPTGSVLLAQGRRFVPLIFRTPSTGGFLISLEAEDWGRA